MLDTGPSINFTTDRYIMQRSTGDDAETSFLVTLYVRALVASTVVGLMTYTSLVNATVIAYSASYRPSDGGHALLT